MSTTADIISPSENHRSSERDQWHRLIADTLDHGHAVEMDVPEPSRLKLLATMFGLNDTEIALIATLWSCAFSPELQSHLLSFDPAIRQLSPLLLTRVFQLEPISRLSTESPVVLWELIREHEFADGSVTLTVDPQIVAWLEGDSDLDQILLSRVTLLSPSFELGGWNLGDYGAQIAACLEKSESCRVFFDTGDELLAQAYATALARKLGVIVAKYAIDDVAPEYIYRHAMRIQRQSFLDCCAPMFSQSQQGLSQPNGIAVFPLQFVLGVPQPTHMRPATRDIVVNPGDLTNRDREAIWQYAVPAIGQWPNENLDDLVWRSHLNATDIVRIGDKQPENLQQATDYIRHSRDNDLDGLAQKVSSQFTWQDLVMPKTVDDRLKEIVFEARERSRLWSNPGARRIFPHGRGLVALLSGPPGSGKTMAAQVIANELGLDLLRIDLSAVVSKWVGETSQNLQRILSAKISQQAVLFFDEADAIYGKRVNDVRNANDRFVNLDSGHLMVALENFDGIVLMATNLRANIDPAFVRRIRHIVEISKPTAPARRKIWLKLIRGLHGPEAGQRFASEVDGLANLEATGAQIKSAVLSSVFAVNRDKLELSPKLLGELLCRELSKDGRGLSEHDLNRILDGA